MQRRFLKNGAHEIIGVQRPLHQYVDFATPGQFDGRTGRGGGIPRIDERAAVERDACTPRGLLDGRLRADENGMNKPAGFLERHDIHNVCRVHDR